MTRLTDLTPVEKKFIDDAIAAAECAAEKKRNQPNRHIVLNAAGGIYLVASEDAAERYFRLFRGEFSAKPLDSQSGA